MEQGKEIVEDDAGVVKEDYTVEANDGREEMVGEVGIFSSVFPSKASMKSKKSKRFAKSQHVHPKARSIFKSPIQREEWKESIRNRCLHRLKVNREKNMNENRYKHQSPHQHQSQDISPSFQIEGEKQPQQAEARSLVQSLLEEERNFLRGGLESEGGFDIDVDSSRSNRPFNSKKPFSYPSPSASVYISSPTLDVGSKSTSASTNSTFILGSESSSELLFKRNLTLSTENVNQIKFGQEEKQNQEEGQGHRQEQGEEHEQEQRQRQRLRQGTCQDLLKQAAFQHSAVDNDDDHNCNNDDYNDEEEEINLLEYLDQILEEELQEEEARLAAEYEEEYHKRIVSHDTGDDDDLISAFQNMELCKPSNLTEEELVICPLCTERYLLQSEGNRSIFCPNNKCHLRLPLKMHDGLTLSHLKTRLVTLTEDHLKKCNHRSQVIFWGGESEQTKPGTVSPLDQMLDLDKEAMCMLNEENVDLDLDFGLPSFLLLSCEKCGLYEIIL